jgi:hypothetical protein
VREGRFGSPARGPDPARDTFASTCLANGERPLSRDFGGPTLGRNRSSSRDDIGRNCHVAACLRVHGTRKLHFQHCVSLIDGTRIKIGVPPKPMCRQVLTARTCRALLSCFPPSESPSRSSAVGRCYLPCTSGCPPTGFQSGRRVRANWTNGVSCGGRSSVEPVLTS